MQMKSKRKFTPFRTSFIFKLSLRDKEYKEQMGKVIMANSLKPYKNELFSSWIARNAVANFLQPPTFINFFFTDYKNTFFNRDIDILISESRADMFANRMLQDRDLIFNTSIQSYAGYLSEDITPNNRNNLISSVKIKGTYPLLKGLKFCPMCLQEKEYFRKEWRLTFYTVCPKHKCFLVDYCQKCGEPINLSKRKLDIDTFNCWNCGHIYKHSEIEYIDKQSSSILYLKSAMDILEKGYFKIGKNYYYSIAYFKILKKVANLIYLNGYRKSHIFDFERKLHKINIRGSGELKKSIIEETMTLKEAYLVFTTSFYILKSKKALKQFIDDNEIKYYLLKKDIKDIPFWYEQFVKQFMIINYIPSDKEIISAYKYIVSKNRKPTIVELSNLLNTCLDKRKREVLRDLFDN